MAILPALFLALATVPAQPTSLVDVAALCSDPSDVEGTKSALLKAGWQPISDKRQAESDKWLSEIDAGDGSKTKSVVFERTDGTDHSIAVSERILPDGSWFRSCGLNDPQNSMGLKLETVKTDLGLNGISTFRLGPAYYWTKSDQNREYMLVLPTSKSGKATLVIGIHGED